jgi:hypothetical protein
MTTAILPLRLLEGTAIDMLHFQVLHIPLRVEGRGAAWC